MSQHPNAEFAQFRFVRDAGGDVVSLPSQGIDERNLLVIDYGRWGFARLHIFEEAAVRKDKLEAFQEEFQRIAGLRDEMLTRLLIWGRDGEELFYADEMLDGEPLPDYLGRTKGVPFPVAAEWIVELDKFLASLPDNLPSFERYSTVNFQVVVDSQDRVRPVFTEFFGWTKPGAQVQEHRAEWYLAQVFCSLVAGVPVRTFHSSSLPRNFDELPGDVGGTVLDALADGVSGARERLLSSLADLAAKADAVREKTPWPVPPLREWLRRDLAASYHEEEVEYELAEFPVPEEERYGVRAVIRGADSTVQILPGPDYLPREGWLNQHHSATRRVGRPTPHQLNVNLVEDRGNLTLVGEESIEGTDLGRLVRTAGALDPETAAAVGKRVSETVRMLESRVGAAAVWWLPPENIFFRTGTRSVDGSVRFLGRKGEEAWRTTPIKLRLHQTAGTLRKGVNLPSVLRELSREPGKRNAAVRRQAVALPLLVFLLTARRFRWRQSLAEQASDIPDRLAALLERSRLALLEEPETVESDLFTDFAALAEAAIGDEEAEAEAEEIEAVRDDGFEKALRETLHGEKVDLSGPPGETARAAAAAASANREEEIEEEEEIDDEDVEGDEEAPRRRPIVLWAAIGGALLALAAGYFLSGWNAETGPAAVAASATPEFADPSYETTTTPSREEADKLLSDYLVQSYRPDLLSGIAEDGPENARAGLDRFLAEKIAGQDSRAAFLLAWRENQPAALVDAAEWGDAEAQRLVAEAVLLRGEPIAGPDQARTFLERAAALGNTPARLLAVDLALEAGDETTARKWAEAAARESDPGGLHRLGLCQARGIGGDPDPEAAAESFAAAAQLGHEPAMLAYATCLEMGFGVEPSATEARRWVNLAEGGEAESTGSSE